MASFEEKELLTVLSQVEHVGPFFAIQRVSIDSREISPGDLYVALKGERFDGHSFLDQAVKNGACTVIIDRQCQWTCENISVFRVDDPLIALGELASHHRKKMMIPIIGITGSIGKTSLKDLLAAALGSKQEVMKTPGNFNNEIGVPLTLLSLTEQHRYGIIEMGMRGLGEISYLTSLAMPTIGIVTNVEAVHIGRLGSLENIAKAKSELISGMTSSTSLSVLNWDDPYVREMSELSKGRVLRFGTSEDADIRGRVVSQKEEGLTIEYQWLNEAKETVLLPLLGRHQLLNGLAAIGVARFLGKTAAEVAAGLQKIEHTSMRLEPLRIKDIFVLNDAYNANVRAMKSALDTFMEVGTGIKTVLLGDMFELGVHGEEAHQEVLKYALELGYQRILVLGEEMRKAATLLAQNRIVCLEDNEKAVQKLEEILQPGDSFLLKGSRGMELEKVLEQWSNMNKA